MCVSVCLCVRVSECVCLLYCENDGGLGLPGGFQGSASTVPFTPPCALVSDIQTRCVCDCQEVCVCVTVRRCVCVTVRTIIDIGIVISTEQQHASPAIINSFNVISNSCPISIISQHFNIEHKCLISPEDHAPKQG